jgi:hypothetical protein
MAIPTYVPLIISLIALIVPILNLLRILFETADGYRKYSEAVIGPWSKLRWRRWSWSEFRFEVHFVTPKLELQDISETRVIQASYRECFLELRDRAPRKQAAEADDTRSRPVGVKMPQRWYSTTVTRQWRLSGSAKRTGVPVLPMRQEGDANDVTSELVGYQQSQRWYRRFAMPHWKLTNSAKRAHALAQSGYVLDSSLTSDFDNRIIHMEIRSALSVMRGDEEQSNSLSVKHRFISDQRVSWLSFLRHLHRVQSRTTPAASSHPPSSLVPDRTASTLAPQPPPDLGPDPWAPLLEKPEGANLDLMKHRHPTGVSVSFVEWTWDSLPAKATRPMATTTLGTLVVMATRLGMQWRIDLEKDSYQASGNGYSLSCTQVPEMGLVATFTAEEKQNRSFPHALAFNTPTDKFMCGIIPGASHLVDEDFHCTDDSGQTDVLKAVLNTIDASDWLHQHLKLHLGSSSDKDHMRWRNMISNEITALLCEFLPYENTNDHIFWGWKDGAGGPAMCPLNSPQLVDALHEQTQYRYGSPGNVFDDISRQIYGLIKLAHADDDEQFMQYIQQIFERTTLWLVLKGYDRDYLRQKLYLHLIAAHCNLSFRAWKATLRLLRDPFVSPRADGDEENITKGSKTGEADNDYRTRRVNVEGKVFYWSGNSPPVEVETEVLARMYMEGSQKDPGGLHDYLSGLHEGDLYMFHDHIEAWHVMMLRGTAWFMSQKRRRGKSTTSSSGGAIPSSLWANQRPVWMI